MAIGEIVVRLELDDKNFKGSISGATKDIVRFENAVKSSSGAVRTSERHHRTWARTLRDSVIVLGLARHAIENVSSLLFAFPTAVIRANAELERMTALMTGLSRESGGVAAAQTDAQKSIDFLFETAKRAPFEIGALTDSFVKMKSVGLDPMGGMFQGLVDSVAKFGGTAENLKRASIAIQQMAGKGVISMEELRQQLGESVPDAMAVMARSMGISMGELVERVSTGTVEAKNALAAMARQMRIENSGAALRMSETWDGMINRMKTSLTLAAKEIGDAGFFDEVKSQLSLLVDGALQDPRFFQLMQSIGQSMTAVISAGTQAAGTIYEYRGAIVDVTQALAAYWALTKTGAIWSAATKGWQAVTGVLAVAKTSINNVRMEMLGARNEVLRANEINRRYELTTKNQSAALAQLTVAANRSKQAFKGLWVAMGGWTTVAFIGIPALIAAMDQLQDKAITVAKEIDKSRPSFMTKKEADALENVLNRYDQIKQRMAELRQAGIELNEGDAGDRNKLAEYGERYREFSGLQAKLRQIETEVLGDMSPDEALQSVMAAKEQHMRNTLDGFARGVELLASKTLREELNNYRDNLEKIINDSQDLSSKQILEARKEQEQILAKQTAAFFEERIAQEKKKLAERRKVQGEDAQEEIELQERRIAKLKEMKEQGLAVFEGGPGELQLLTNEGAQEELTKLEQFLLSRQKMLAKYTSKSEGGNPYLDEFDVMVDEGAFAKATTQELERARQVMTKLWQARQAWDAQNAETQAFGDALERIDQLSGMIGSKFAQRQNNNPLMRDAIEAEKLRAKLSEVGEEVSAMTMIDQGARRAALEELYQLGQQVEENARQATVAQMEETTNQLRISMLPAMEQVEAQYNDLIAKALEWKAAQDQMTPEQLEAFNAYLEQLNRKMADEMKTPMDQLMEQWSDSTTQMQGLWTNTMESFVDTLTNGLIEGKLQLADFVEEFARMMIKMQMQQVAAGLVTSIAGAFSPGVQNVGSAAGAAGYSTTGYAGAYGFANGGIMTSKGALALETYSNGGIANKPQLALYGEGRQPEAYVPLPDGRTIPVTIDAQGAGGGGGQLPVTINVINEAGQPVEAESDGPKFNGEQYVLDIVLKGLNRPGNFRSGVKTALSK